MVSKGSATVRTASGGSGPSRLSRRERRFWVVISGCGVGCSRRSIARSRAFGRRRILIMLVSCPGAMWHTSLDIG